MRDLYKEGYKDAVREMDQAITAACKTKSTPLEQLNSTIGHLHSMNLRANTKTHESDDVTFDDFLQDAGIAYIIKGGI